MQVGRLIYELSGYETNYYSTPIISIDYPLYGGFDEASLTAVAKRDFQPLKQLYHGHENNLHNFPERDIPIIDTKRLAFRKGDIIEMTNRSIPICFGRNKRTGNIGQFSLYDVRNEIKDINYKLFSDFVLSFNRTS